MRWRYLVLLAVLILSITLVAGHGLLGDRGEHHAEDTVEQDTATNAAVSHPSDNPTTQFWALTTTAGIILFSGALFYTLSRRTGAL